MAVAALTTPTVLMSSLPADAAKPLKASGGKGKPLRAFGPTTTETTVATTVPVTTTETTVATTVPVTTTSTTAATTTTTVATTVPPSDSATTDLAGVDCAPLHLSTDLRDYLRLAGDQMVVVPNGTYTGGSVVADHPATSGAYGGWLVLVAESAGQVVVDLSAGELNLQAGTSRIMFVGFTFKNGRVRNHGQHIRYWYTRHTFPYDTWVGAGGPTGVNSRPKAMLVGSAQNVEIYGSDFTDIGDDGINLYKSNDIRIEGTTFSRIDNFGHSDLIHADAIQIQGRISRMTVRQSVIERQHIGTELNGDLVDMVWEDSWFRDSRSTGISFAAKKLSDGTPLTITGRRTNIRSFGHSNGIDRHDIVDGTVKPPNSVPTRINVVDTGIITSPPPAGTPSPADVWRVNHPFGTWRTLFIAL